MTKYMMPRQPSAELLGTSAAMPCHFPSILILAQYIVYVNRISQKVGFFLQLRQILQNPSERLGALWEEGLKFGYIIFSYLI